MKKMSLVFLFLFSLNANSAVGRHSEEAVTTKDIGEFESLNEQNIFSEEGYQQFRGCVAARALHRGSVVKSEDIACLSSR